MARTIPCDLCGAEDAEIMYTTFSDGSTIGIGKMCAPNFVVGLAIALGILPDPSEIPTVAEAAPEAAQESDGQDVPQDMPALPKRRPRRSQPTA